MGDGTPTTRLVTSVEIARLAGVGRAAVSNWRRRYPDFPAPAGGPDNRPAFSLEEVEQWLADTGKGEQLRVDGVTKTGTQRLEHTVRPATLARIQDAVGGGRAVPGPSLRTSGRTNAPLGKTPELVAEERAEKQRARYAAALAALLPERTQGIAVDPACGVGDLLEAAAIRFGATVALVGCDEREDAVHTAKARMADASVRELATGDALTGDQLRRYRGAAAAVLCEPPHDRPQWPADELAHDPRWIFGLPAPRDAELAWVQLCFDFLKPNGTAVVAASPRSCVQQSGRSVRAAMLRAGAFRRIIALPKGAKPDGPETVVWVLRNPGDDQPEHRVTMVDLTDVEPADVPVDHAAWQAVFADRTCSTETAVIDLLDDEVALLPARFVPRDTRELSAAYTTATDRLPALLKRLADGFPRLEHGRGEPDFPLVSLHELERIGSLHVRPRTFTPRTGDILIHAGGRAPTVVEPEDLAQLSRQHERGTSGISHVIEIDEDRLDPYFVAGFLQADAVLMPTANTASTLSRDDLRRCRVPRLPLATQRHYGAAFRRLSELDSVLRATTELSGHVLRLAAAGLVAGALAPTDNDGSAQ